MLSRDGGKSANEEKSKSADKETCSIELIGALKLGVNANHGSRAILC